MAETNPTSTPRLLSPLTLLGIAVTLVVALILLFPGQDYFTGLGVKLGETSTDVSIAYLQKRLREDPDNVVMRLDLVRELMKAGLYEQARRILAPVAGSDDPDVRWVRLELTWRRYVAMAPGSEARAERREAVESQLEALPLSELSDSQLEAAARLWLALERPGQASLVYERLAVREGRSPERRYLGEWWLNDPREQVRRKAALDALKTARQSTEVDAVAMARRLLAHDPEYAALLDLAIEIAWSQGDLKTAMEWADRYAGLRPDDRAAAERKVKIELQAGRPEKAAATLRDLLRRYPDATAQRETLARVLEWTGKPQQALAQWRRLARRSGAARHDREVIRLALMVDDREAAVAALDRLRRRTGLSPEQRRLLTTYLDQQGEPRKAIERLRRWLASGSGDVALWRYLARLQESTGDIEGALATWKRYAARNGRGLEETLERARLNGRLWRPGAALSVLESLPRRPEPGSDPRADEYWRLLGDYAWHVQRHEIARQAYAELHRAGSLDAERYQRLIVAALRTGETELAMEAAAAGWREYHDPALLEAALRGVGDPERRQALFDLAGEAPDEVARRGAYWHLYGDYQYQRGNLKKAYEAYRKALAIDSGSSWLRASFLFLLAESGRHGELERYLAKWRDTARDDGILWGAYAAAYSALDRPRRALPWYRRATAARPGDYLLQLDYADALERLHRFDEAFRVRRHALTELRPRLLARLKEGTPRTEAERKRHARVVESQFPLLDGSANRAWLARVLADRGSSNLDAADTELLLSWHLSSEAPAYARYWHLQAQMRRLRTPAWQRMAVALAANDQPAVDRLLRRESADLSVADRVTALRRLDRREAAQTLALDNLRSGLRWTPGAGTLRLAAAELYREMPQRAGLRSSARELGGIAVYDGRSFYEHSHERWGVAVEAGFTRVGNGDVRVVLDGLDETTHAGLALTHRQRRGRTRLELRRIEDDAADHLYAGLSQDYRLTRDMEIGLFAETESFSRDTGLLRAFAVQDRAGMSLGWAFTARDSLSLSADYHDYETREEGGDLGDGYTVEAAISRAVTTGPTYAVDLRLIGQTTRNTPAGALPADLVSRMPAGTIPADLVPEEFSFVGAGFGLYRGMPDQPYPLTASPRYFLDVNAGYSRPEGDFSISASAGIGMRVLGGDELSLTLGIDQEGTAAASRSSRVMLGYQYFFGR